MGTIKNLFKTIDIFGINFSFRYKDKERYQTVLGGFILFLFLILILIFGIYNLIPFMNRQNYTIVYYTMNLAVTEEVNLFQSESNFAIGVNCELIESEKFIANDLLDFSAKYVLYAKNNDGSYNKMSDYLATHKCTYDDFYNKYDSQVDYLGLSNYQCLEKREGTIQGIFADKVFSYFEFTVSAKNDSVVDEIDRFLFENDCKFEIVYNSIIIDLDNYTRPITQLLDTMFIQLNPILFIKRNIYFMNQYFSNDNYLVFVFRDEKPDLKTLYSNYEEYSLYMGMGRINTKPYNYDKYAKIFLRAALKKTIINRKYQKIMEFFADVSSILMVLYQIIYIIFNFIDNFYAYHSLSKNLFFFKGIGNENNYNIFQKRKQIQDLISLLENQIKYKNINPFESNPPKLNNIDKNNKIGIINNNEKNDSDKDNMGIKIYNSKNIQLNTNKKIKIINVKINARKEQKVNSGLIISKVLQSQKKYDKYESNSKENEVDGINSKIVFQKNNKRNNTENLIAKLNKNTNNKAVDFEDNKNKFSSTSSLSKPQKNIKFIQVSNSFNIFEILLTHFFNCCLSRNMTIKNNLNENATEIINKKLNIITYIRNMILFDLINKTILDNCKKDIINFLCRPVISVNKNQKIEFEEFYKSYKEKDFDKFTKNVHELVKKSHKNAEDIKWISISKEHLNKLM